VLSENDRLIISHPTTRALRKSIAPHIGFLLAQLKVQRRALPSGVVAAADAFVAALEQWGNDELMIVPVAPLAPADGKPAITFEDPRRAS
jgi:hypothetical protein